MSCSFMCQIIHIATFPTPFYPCLVNTGNTTTIFDRKNKYNDKFTVLSEVYISAYAHSFGLSLV